MLTHHRPKRTVSGGRYKAYRGKRLFERASTSTLTKIGPVKRAKLRMFGGKVKYRSFEAEMANVKDPKGKFSKVKIKTIVENPANTNYVRRNIITKGTIIDTEKGKARVTNSPGSEGAVNAVLI